jgi:hypothetical protein
VTVHEPDAAADHDRGGEGDGAGPADPGRDDGQGPGEAVLRHDNCSQLGALGE